jgi:hypothetical protein
MMPVEENDERDIRGETSALAGNLVDESLLPNLESRLTISPFAIPIPYLA